MLSVLFPTSQQHIACFSFISNVFVFYFFEQMLSKSLHMQGAQYSFKINYEDIKSLFLLPKPGTLISAAAMTTVLCTIC